jgi:hypothetical protein
VLCLVRRLSRGVVGGKRSRPWFRIELTLLAVVFAIAVVVCGLALALPIVGPRTSYALYASAIGVAFVLVSMALGLAPRLPVEVAEAARETYQVSTLANDCVAALEKLDALIRHEQVYENPDLDLPGLAARLGLSGHQLSELINTRLGKGFSRYRKIAARGPTAASLGRNDHSGPKNRFGLIKAEARLPPARHAGDQPGPANARRPRNSEVVR